MKNTTYRSDALFQGIFLLGFLIFLASFVGCSSDDDSFKPRQDTNQSTQQHTQQQQGNTAPTPPPTPTCQYPVYGRHHYKFAARSMLPIEARNYVLPYRSTREHSVDQIDLAESNGWIDSEFRYVKDHQVLVMIDALLPARETLGDVKDIRFEMKFTKVSKDGWPSTEMLCLLDRRACSGQLFGAVSWQDNINPEFFAENEKPYNDNFSRQILTLKTTYRGNPRYYMMDGKVSISLSDLLEGSGWTDVGYLYDTLGGHLGNVQRAIPIVVADDIFIKEASLVMDTEQYSCPVNDEPNPRQAANPNL